MAEKIFWQGKFTGTKQEMLVFYSPGDGAWWLGTVDAGTSSPTIAWTLFGNKSMEVSEQSLTWIADPDSSGTDQLFVFDDSQILWQVDFNGPSKEASWTQVATRPDIPAGAPTGYLQGRFTAAHQQLLASYEPDPRVRSWYLIDVPPGESSVVVKSVTGSMSNFEPVFGLAELGSPCWSGPFGPNCDGVLVCPSIGKWYTGTISDGGGNSVLFPAQNPDEPICDTSGFGDIRFNPMWLADFADRGLPDLMFYSPGDGNWWYGTISGTSEDTFTMFFRLVATQSIGPTNMTKPQSWIMRQSTSGQLGVLICVVSSSDPSDATWWFTSYDSTGEGKLTVSQVHTGLPIGPTSDQASAVATNLSALQKFNDYVYEHSTLPFSETLTVLSEPTSDPGVDVGVILVQSIFAAVGAFAPTPVPDWWAPAAQFVVTFVNGLVASWKSDVPETLDQDLLNWTNRYGQTSTTLDQQLAGLSDDIPGNWTTAFAWNGMTRSLSDLAFVHVPVEKTDTVFVDLATASVQSLLQQLWSTILQSGRFVIDYLFREFWDGDPTTTAQTSYKQHPSQYAQWYWDSNQSEYEAQVWQIGPAPGGGIDPATLNGDACAMLFVDSTPGVIVNQFGIFTRQYVFTSLGLEIVGNVTPPVPDPNWPNS